MQLDMQLVYSRKSKGEQRGKRAVRASQVSITRQCNRDVLIVCSHCCWLKMGPTLHLKVKSFCEAAAAGNHTKAEFGEEEHHKLARRPGSLKSDLEQY